MLNSTRFALDYQRRVQRYLKMILRWYSDENVSLLRLCADMHQCTTSHDLLITIGFSKKTLTHGRALSESILSVNTYMISLITSHRSPEIKQCFNIISYTLFLFIFIVENVYSLSTSNDSLTRGGVTKYLSTSFHDELVQSYIHSQNRTLHLKCSSQH